MSDGLTETKMKSWSTSLLYFFILFQNSLCKEVSIKKATFSEFWFEKTFLLAGVGEQWKLSEGKDGIETCSNGEEAEMWLLTKTVNAEKILHDVQIYVEIEAQMRKCEGIYDCFKDEFGLYRYIGNGEPNVDYDVSDPAKANEEKQKARKYFNNNFAYLGDITGNTTIKQRINTTVSLTLKEFQGITFGIKSRGACGKVFRMNVYYYVCEKKFINSVLFKETLSPPNGTKVVFGNCSLNSRPALNLDSLKTYCYSNGTWSEETNIKCNCDKGYEPTMKRGCTPCQYLWFKPSFANEKCMRCPRNTISAKNFTTCTCKIGYYKLPRDLMTKKLSNCYAPIKLDKPKIEKVEDSIDSVNITWFPPVNNSRINVTICYDIHCYTCVNETFCNTKCTNLVYTPGQYNITETYVRVSGLVVGQRYQFRVFPQNSLNKVVPREKWEFATSDTYTFRSKENVSVSQSDDLPTLLVTGNLLFVFAVMIVIIIILLIRLLKRRKVKKFRPRQQLRDYQDFPLPPSEQNYSDPITYDNPERVVSELANNIEEHLYEIPDELGIALYEEVLNLVPLGEHRPVNKVEEINLQNTELERESKYLIPGDNGAQTYEEVPVLTRTALADVNKKRPNDTHEEPLINDLVYAVPLDDETKPCKRIITELEDRRTKNNCFLRSKLLKDNTGYLLSVAGETDLSRNVQFSETSAYAKLNKNAQNGENVDDYQKLLKRDSDYVIPADDETDANKNAQIMEPSAYAQLDKNRQNRRDGENAHDYQQLLNRDSDYVIPAGGETDPSLNAQITEPSAYAQLDKNRRNGKDVEDADDYQKLLKLDSDYVIPADGKTDPSQNIQIIEPSTYAQLDKNRQSGREVENVYYYQKLLKRGSDYVIPAGGETDTNENVQILKSSAYTEVDNARQVETDTERLWNIK